MRRTASPGHNLSIVAQPSSVLGCGGMSQCQAAIHGMLRWAVPSSDAAHVNGKGAERAAGVRLLRMRVVDKQMHTSRQREQGRCGMFEFAWHLGNCS